MPFARRMRSFTPTQIRLTDPFWMRYQKVLVETSLPLQYEQILKTGRLENFRRVVRQETGTHEGIYFNDSDVYKFVEACAYAIQSGVATASPESVAELRHAMNDSIDGIVEAQDASGYINTFFQLNHPDHKWRNLNAMHEMYCGGHLIEAGVAVFEALGDRRLLDVSIKFADHVMSVFGVGKRRGYCGHEEIELALIRLSYATSEPKYRELAEWMVEARGNQPSPFEAELDDPIAVGLSPWSGTQLKSDGRYNGEYAQDHAPIREHTEIVGHAVRAMYLYIAATDLADGKQDNELEAALERIWGNLTRKRMYITGGIGPSSKNEGFTGDYDLPNLSAYAETCAACGLIFWGQRLLELTGNSEYGDIVERALYNGAISGISLDGANYFYDNPLESRGQHHRVPWFGCACCPPNLARLIASVGNYVAGISADTVFIHFPASFEADFVIKGVTVKIALEGNYPFSGEYIIRIEPKQPVAFALKLRIPDWSDEMSTDFPMSDEEAEYDNGYASFDRIWSTGDTLKVDLGIQPKWIEADPRVRDNLGRAALTFGPLVYCAEQKDLGLAPQLFSADVEAEIVLDKSKILEGVTTLTVDGVANVEEFVDSLYPEVGTSELKEATAKFIPYFAWNNRGSGDMQVWVRKL